MLPLETCSVRRFPKTLLRPKQESKPSLIFTCAASGTSFDGHHDVSRFLDRLPSSSRFPTVSSAHNVPSEVGIERCNHWHHGSDRALNMCYLTLPPDTVTEARYCNFNLVRISCHPKSTCTRDMCRGVQGTVTHIRLSVVALLV